MYHPSMDRNDRALLNYFFVQERDPPLLCLEDLPEHGSFGNTRGLLPSDDELYGPGGRFRTQVCNPCLHRGNCKANNSLELPVCMLVAPVQLAPCPHRPFPCDSLELSQFNKTCKEEDPLHGLQCLRTLKRIIK